MDNFRVIFCHKQATSALLRFMLFDNTTACAPDALPKLSSLVQEPAPRTNVVLHPKAAIGSVATPLGFCTSDWERETEFTAHVDVQGGIWPVFLARFTTQDPPFMLARRVDASFVDLARARHLPDTELQLLRIAYEALMEG